LYFTLSVGENNIMKHWPFPIVYGKIPGSNKPKEQSMENTITSIDNIIQLMDDNNIFLFRHFDINQGKHIIISQSKILAMEGDEYENIYDGMSLDQLFKAVQHEIQVRELIA
jgi:hypothetical protein